MTDHTQVVFNRILDQFKRDVLNRNAKSEIVADLRLLGEDFKPESTIYQCIDRLANYIEAFKVVPLSIKSELQSKVEFLFLDIEAEIETEAREDLGFSADGWGTISQLQAINRVKPVLKNKAGMDFTAQTIFKAMDYNIDETFVGKWFTVSELANLTGLNEETIEVMFADYPHLIDNKLTSSINPDKCTILYRLSTPFKSR